MNRPKQTGTKAETCVARYLIAAGVPNVARRTLTGSPSDWQSIYGWLNLNFWLAHGQTEHWFFVGLNRD